MNVHTKSASYKAFAVLDWFSRRKNAYKRWRMPHFQCRLVGPIGSWRRLHFDRRWNEKCSTWNVDCSWSRWPYCFFLSPQTCRHIVGSVITLALFRQPVPRTRFAWSSSVVGLRELCLFYLVTLKFRCWMFQVSRRSHCSAHGHHRATDVFEKLVGTALGSEPSRLRLFSARHSRGVVTCIKYFSPPYSLGNIQQFIWVVS